jgi:hypothetical protein
MSEPSLPELEAERDRLFAQLSSVGDFRRWSVSQNCGRRAGGSRGSDPRWDAGRWLRARPRARDAELGVAGASLSPGQAAMTDRAAAAGPFAVDGSCGQCPAGR